MDLYNFSNNKLAQIERQDFALEKEIQDLVESNVSELFNLQFISSEFQIGNFRLDTGKHLVTQDGNFLLDKNKQKIKIEDNSAKIDIGPDGTISMGNGFGNQQAGTLSLVKFEDARVLAKEGNGLYKIMDNTIKPLAADDIKVEQGVLERSNVNSIEEMTNMITAIRGFEAYQKVIQSIDEADDQAVNSIGRVV